MKITTRLETREDYPEVRRINLEAFESPAEAYIVEALRLCGDPVISIVAEADGALAGHIMFSPVYLDGGGSGLRLCGLAPMAVEPGRQKKGIGSALAATGIDACVKAGYCAIFVLGHPGYYPRFGFSPAGRLIAPQRYRLFRRFLLPVESQGKRPGGFLVELRVQPENVFIYIISGSLRERVQPFSKITVVTGRYKIRLPLAGAGLRGGPDVGLPHSVDSYRRLYLVFYSSRARDIPDLRHSQNTPELIVMY